MSPVFDTDYPADSVEFCPNPGFSNIFVCGTYKLVESPKPPAPGLPTPKAYRKGQCLVFRLNESDDLSLLIENSDHVQTLDYPAIPDLKWCHGRTFPRPTLAIADSEGSVSLCQWDHDTGAMIPINSIQCADIDTLCLSLDWNNRLVDAKPLSLAVSLSNGELAYLQVDSTGDLRVIGTWHSHDYEPWVTSWNYHDPNMLFSGGDDLTLKLWDIRNGFERPVMVNRKFEAGVTCIQSHLVDSDLVAVGSYDEKVRFFDTRNLLRPLDELGVGGGAWRIKWHPSASRQNELLIACMHDGFKVGRYSKDTPSSILSEFREHESLAYGADWSFSEGGEKTPIATCSFYDHKLHVWSA
ncbi:WD-40 repeat-containing protein [Coprinopsis cinerea okayama7|uniref:methylated diphthine methylhydrolase n=1 Tax=Coprinopsis cinerea (strain Okayama-7 / 130 / ATCC MYA-4618 / FGSC 9003) TaxID=240176 RepID=D6RK60_COPC7|nr:WD-40 repeat-containing protein [Coprinopsis cinerea okayama7\|eukprot:XP_002912109.1 WD-40 repeat-containing protein [Coprinopsis cinerea okayama7\